MILTVTSTVHMDKQTKPRSFPLLQTTIVTLIAETIKHTTEETSVLRAKRYKRDCFQSILELRPTFINGWTKSHVK